jgi:ribonuclease R
LERGTSIYLADRVIPMLPEKLSNDLCSLNPKTDKLTLTCEMKISGKTGQLVNSKVYNSLINSDFRLTYKDVDEILKPLSPALPPSQGEGSRTNSPSTLPRWKGLGDRGFHFGQEVTRELLNALKNANILKDLISNFRKKNGSLDFDFKETYIKFETENNVD